jgi:hypothetical protein
VQVHHDEGVANRIDPESCANTRELGPYGSVRGARGNSRPYRDRHLLTVGGRLCTRIAVSFTTIRNYLLNAPALRVGAHRDFQPETHRVQNA